MVKDKHKHDRDLVPSHSKYHVVVPVGTWKNITVLPWNLSIRPSNDLPDSDDLPVSILTSICKTTIGIFGDH
jgi:hypothetical protein